MRSQPQVTKFSNKSTKQAWLEGEVPAPVNKFSNKSHKHRCEGSLYDFIKNYGDNQALMIDK